MDNGDLATLPGVMLGSSSMLLIWEPLKINFCLGSYWKEYASLQLPSTACLAQTPAPSRCTQLLSVQLTSLCSRYQLKDLANHLQYCAQLTKYYKKRFIYLFIFNGIFFTNPSFCRPSGPMLLELLVKFCFVAPGAREKSVLSVAMVSFSNTGSFHWFKRDCWLGAPWYPLGYN